MSDLISRAALLDAMPKNDELLSLDVRRVICNAPAVDAEPVAHGKWETQGRDATCSVCKYIQIGAYRAMWYSPYCPSCGAKMDLKEVPDAGNTM